MVVQYTLRFLLVLFCDGHVNSMGDLEVVN